MQKKIKYRSKSVMMIYVLAGPLDARLPPRPTYLIQTAGLNVHHGIIPCFQGYSVLVSSKEYILLYWKR